MKFENDLSYIKIQKNIQKCFCYDAQFYDVK